MSEWVKNIAAVGIGVLPINLIMIWYRLTQTEDFSTTDMIIYPLLFGGGNIILILILNKFLLNASFKTTFNSGKGVWYLDVLAGLVLSGIYFLMFFGERKTLMKWLPIGVETFMAQIETLYFNSAIKMGTSELVGIVASGALRAVIFAPLAVLIYSSMKKPTQPEVRNQKVSLSGLWKRFVLLTFLYVVIYFVFGYFIAWQWAEIRLFYSGTVEIKPFFIHFRDLFLTDPIIFPFQIVRGAMWTALAILIVRMMIAKRWECSLAVALIFAGLLSSGIELFPNPYMPPMVRRAHFFELLSSILVFGGVAGWSVSFRKT